MTLPQGVRQQARRAESVTAAVPCASPLLLSHREAVHARLEGISCFEFVHEGRPQSITAALPGRYRKSGRRRAPLLILIEAGELFGSAVEMSRLLASSRELEECIVVDAAGLAAGDARGLDALIADCQRRFRVSSGQVAVYAQGLAAGMLLRHFSVGIRGANFCILGSAAPIATVDIPPDRASAIAWTITTGTTASQPGIVWQRLPEASATGLAVPALLHGLRSFWGRQHQYGDEVMPLSHPAFDRSACALAPLLRRLLGRKAFAAETGNRQVVRAEAMGRDFEVFVALPEQAARRPGERLPLLIALDANGGFATVVETVARLARAGEIRPAIVVGIGTPRAQGALEFGFRRFEELSPPIAEDYHFDDALGRVFRSLFALRGQDAREQLGQAPAFHDFITRELLPRLVESLPVDQKAVSLLGHSAAGTFVAYALAQPRSPFSGFLCLSPGVTISGSWMMRTAASCFTRRGGAVRLFVAIGGEELRNRFNEISGIPQTRDWVQGLRAEGLATVECHVLEGETHTSVYPRALAQGLAAILPGDQA